MTYGPGYVLWKQILRERAQRRAARLQARRLGPTMEAASVPEAAPSQIVAPRRRAAGRSASRAEKAAPHRAR
jgi:hypothetical protein